ncbi:integration host factor subunit beta [candidate division KSB3 bacterium]|uniref:Integration host factor subunit beta n=1 Tax=candidate division KSB3 bacterium TaxID=2044937 RepID=A0A2G6E5F9_9BACT|nr:MAG: integration host factor subunit beta [candidate division KSB3 bacterium]PIE29674.1 MAG: integration host factor subunit beta [candidate division KSB3 bacterium]
MTRLDIAKIVASEANLTQQKANEAVIEMLDVLKETLEQGERIECRGFGIFMVRDRNPRLGRNPRTGEEAPIAKGKTIKFKAGKEFKERIWNECPEQNDSADTSSVKAETPA